MASKLKIYIIRPLRDTLLYLLTKFLFLLAPLLPRRLMLGWHSFLARIAYKLGRSVRERIIHHYQYALGLESKDGEYYNMGKELFVNLSKTFTDYILFNRKRTWREFSKYFRVEGLEHLQRAYNQGKGVLCMVSHTPGWEFSAILPPLLGFPTLGVSSKIKNEALNRLMIDMRQTRGMRNITRSKCYDTLLDEMRQGRCLIIMIDQDSKNIRGEFLTFFGKEAYTPIGLARLAMDSGAAVVPMYTIRHNNTESYTFVIDPPIPFVMKDSPTETLRYNTQQYNNSIEEMVRRYPTQWVWMHERWKTTPESLQSFLERKRLRAAHTKRVN